MKRLNILFIFVLCTACAPMGIPTVEPSATGLASQRPRATAGPSSTPRLFPTATPTSIATLSPTLTPARLPPTSTPLLEVVIDNLAISPQGQVYASGFGRSGGIARQFAQWDGTQWVALGDGFQTAGNTLAVDSQGQLYTEILKESEQGMTTAIMQWNGAGWEDISGNFNEAVDALKAGRISSNIPVASLAVDGEDHLYAAGSFYYPIPDHTSEVPLGYVARWDQENWTVLGQGFEGVNILDLAVSSTGEGYITGEQLTPEGISSYIAAWEGETWTPLDTSQLNTVQNIVLDQSGGLYAHDQSNEIAVWDGSDWRILADEWGGEASTVFDMATDKNGYLYIGGSFDAVNGIPAQSIAYWDGTSWQALGEGLNERVNALAFHSNGELYAVGFFTQAGGLPAYHAARWDGETWHELGP